MQSWRELARVAAGGLGELGQKHDLAWALELARQRQKKLRRHLVHFGCTRDSDGTHSIIRKEALNVCGAGRLSRQHECRPLVEHLAGELAIEILWVERGNTEIIGRRAAVAQCGSRAPEPIFG